MFHMIFSVVETFFVFKQMIVSTETFDINPSAIIADRLFENIY